MLTDAQIDTALHGLARIGLFVVEDEIIPILEDLERKAWVRADNCPSEWKDERWLMDEEHQKVFWVKVAGAWQNGHGAWVRPEYLRLLPSAPDTREKEPA